MILLEIAVCILSGPMFVNVLKMGYKIAYFNGAGKHIYLLLPCKRLIGSSKLDLADKRKLLKIVKIMFQR